MHPAAFQRAFDGRFLDLLSPSVNPHTSTTVHKTAERNDRRTTPAARFRFFFSLSAYFLLAVVIRLGLELRSLLLPIRHLLVLVSSSALPPSLPSF